ncbi:MAG: hypothetical protein VW258_11510, partial [Thalassolituus sp.]
KVKMPYFAVANRNCHNNAVAAVTAGRADKVWMCLAGSKDDFVVHFINSKDGEYFDETWGDKSRWYHVVREIAPSEFEHIGYILNAYKDDFVESNGSWIERYRHNRGGRSI